MPLFGRRLNPGSRRVLKVDDSDTESSSSNSPQRAKEKVDMAELSQEEKDRNAILMSIADLGSARRAEITAADKGPAPVVNLTKLLKDRECEVPGSNAGKLAAENRDQLKSWTSFGSTDMAKSSAVEELDNIGNGQSHRQAMVARLSSTGVGMRAEEMSLGHARQAGSGGGGYRPLDPAIVEGEKDSRYGKNGLKAKGRAKVRPNVRLEEVTVKVTRGESGGSRFQKRPWPPKGLEHLPPAPLLADPSSFMAAALQALNQAPVQGADAGVSSITVGGMSVSVKPSSQFSLPEKSGSKKTSEAPKAPQEPKEPKELKELTKEATKKVTEQTKELELDIDRLRDWLEKNKTGLVIQYLRHKLGIRDDKQLGLEAEAEAKAVKEAVKEAVKVDAKAADSKVNPFNPRTDSKVDASKAAQPGFKEVKEAKDVKEVKDVKPEVKPEVKTGWALKPLAESKWATGPVAAAAAAAAGRAPLQPKPSKSNGFELFSKNNDFEALRKSSGFEAFKANSAAKAASGQAKGLGLGLGFTAADCDSMAIYGDVQALCKLPTMPMAPLQAQAGSPGTTTTTTTTTTGGTRIKRTSAGPGYEALLREMKQAKQAKEREMAAAAAAAAASTSKAEQEKSGHSPVTQALKFADSVSKGLDDEDDWEL